MQFWMKVSKWLKVLGLQTDTIVESTAAAGVTVDGCLIKDGRVAALATAGRFKSSEQTGTGSAQNVAHGLSAAPTLVMIVPTEITGGAYDVTEGTHTSTNVVVTVTSGEKFVVYAWL